MNDFWKCLKTWAEAAPTLTNSEVFSCCLPTETHSIPTETHTLICSGLPPFYRRLASCSYPRRVNSKNSWTRWLRVGDARPVRSPRRWPSTGGTDHPGGKTARTETVAPRRACNSVADKSAAYRGVPAVCLTMKRLSHGGITGYREVSIIRCVRPSM